MKNKAHLRMIEDNDEGRRCNKIGKSRPANALERVKGAKDTEEAFYLLLSWSGSQKALNAQAYEVEEELQQGGFELLRCMLEDNFRSRGLGDVGEAIIKIDTEDELVRLSNRREHQREYESIFGTITLSP